MVLQTLCQFVVVLLVELYNSVDCLFQSPDIFVEIFESVLIVDFCEEFVDEVIAIVQDLTYLVDVTFVFENVERQEYVYKITQSRFSDVLYFGAGFQLLLSYFIIRGVLVFFLKDRIVFSVPPDHDVSKILSLVEKSPNSGINVSHIDAIPLT